MIQIAYKGVSTLNFALTKSMRSATSTGYTAVAIYIRSSRSLPTQAGFRAKELRTVNALWNARGDIIACFPNAPTSFAMQVISNESPSELRRATTLHHMNRGRDRMPEMPFCSPLLNS